MTSITSINDPGAPGVRPTGGLVGVYALQVRNEVNAARRSAEYVVGLVAIPVLLYVMFGLPGDTALIPGGTRFSTLAIGSFGAYGIVSLSILTFGDEVAKERGRGWLRTLRVTPIPGAVYLVGKLAMALVYAACIVVALAAISIPTGASSLSALQWLTLTGVLLGGVLAFSTIGLALAYLVRPRAATTIANLVFLPLSFASGFFFPLSQLPGIVRDVAPYLPTYHFGQLVWQVVGTEADAAALTGLPASNTAVHLAWVVGCLAAGGALALWAARRESVSRRT